MIRKLRIHLGFSPDDWPILGESEIKLSNTHTGKTLQLFSFVPRKGDWIHIHEKDIIRLHSITTDETLEVVLIVHNFNHIYIDTTIYLKPL